MTISDILKKELTGKYEGFILQMISETSFDPAEIGIKALKRIPAKISYFLHSDKIKEAFRCSTEKRKDVEDFYIVRAKDGTLFQLHY